MEKEKVKVKSIILFLLMIIFLFCIIPFGILHIRGIDPFELPPELRDENLRPPMEVERIETDLEEIFLPNQ